MTREQNALRAQIDRQLLTVGQKIDRQTQIAETAQAALVDLQAVRAALLGSAVALRTGGRTAMTAEDRICQWQTLNPPRPVYEYFSGYEQLRHYNPFMEMAPRRSLDARYASFRARLEAARGRT